MYEVSHQKNNLDCHAPFGRSQGQADPSASLLQSGNFKIYSFFICLLNEKMTSITKIKAIALTKLNNAEYGAFMDS